MSKPLVSVIMPVFNAEKYLEGAIKSILTQTLSDFEFIIINDASTDKSKEIIQSFSDPRIHYFENDKNEGYIYSLNNALHLAQGDFIARMDADDLSLPDRFHAQHLFLQENNSIDLVGSSIKVIREGRKNDELWEYPISPGGVKARLLFNTAHAHPVVFFRRTLIDRKLYQYDPAFYPAEDYRLWVRLNQHVNTSNLLSAQLIYRISAAQTSSVNHVRQRHHSSLIRVSYFHDLLSNSGLPERIVHDFWDNGFKIETQEALQMFDGYESIYKNSKDPDFKKELALQMNSLISRIYQIHPEFVSRYNNSSFNKGYPLSLKDRIRFTMYPIWKQFKSR